MSAYRKCTDVEKELRQHILELRNAGEERLENERELAIRFRTGRPTIAKALALLEQKNLIQLTKRGAKIIPFRQKFRYVYVATIYSINDTFWYPAYQALWDELSKTAAKLHLKIDLVLHAPDIDPEGEKLIEKIKTYDIIFFSLIGEYKTMKKRLLDMKLPIILLNENMETEGFPLYALHNFEVGAFAARLLLERGYRKTALLAPAINTASFDFSSRIAGFASVINSTNERFELFSTHTGSNMEELRLLQQCINKLPSQGFDSIFFLDDLWVIICDSLIESGRVPDFGILAFDGTGNSRRHKPPIDTLSHGTIPLTEKICSIITDNECGVFQYDPDIRCRILPRYFRGRTLRESTN